MFAQNLKNVLLVSLIFTLVACSIPTPAPTAIPQPTATSVPPTNTAVPPTNVVAPTNTTAPTATTAPTSTVAPTSTTAPVATLAPTVGVQPTAAPVQPTAVPVQPAATKPAVPAGQGKITVTNNVTFKIAVAIWGPVEKQFEVEPGKTLDVEVPTGEYGWQVFANQCRLVSTNNLRVAPNATISAETFTGNSCGYQVRWR